MDLGLQNETVLITASSSGIGFAIAKSFLNEGARVIINGRDENKIKKIVVDLYKIYGKDKVYYFIGDMTLDNKIKECFEYVTEKFASIDILIPNLGNGKAMNLDFLNHEEWERIIDINLYSVVRILKKFIPLLKINRGNIVLISSITAIERNKAPYAYSASKLSLLSLIKNLSYELAKDDVRINGVVPGNIYFEGGRWEEIVLENPNVINDYIEKDVPLRRFGTAKEIADSVVFLASKCSSFTTGAALIVDGGETKTYI